MAHRILLVLCLAVLITLPACQQPPPERVAEPEPEPSRVQVTSGPANDFAPRCSPDGRRIAFTSNRAGTSDIFLASADGEEITQITTPDRANAL